MKKRIKMQGIIIFLVVCVSLVLARFMFSQWKKEALDEFLDFLGIALILFGYLFRISARGHKAESSSEGEKLITTGPYYLMRNPMYFGTLLIVLGVASVLFQWWAFFLFLSVYLLIYIPQVSKEENILRRRFGDDYGKYCLNVPKYFPNIFTLFKNNPRDYLMIKWQWVKKELTSFIIAIASIIIIEAWLDAKMFKEGEYLKEVIELLLTTIFFVVLFSLFYKKKNASGK